MALYTGLRRGELFGLQWGDIDFGSGHDDGRMHVRRSLYHGNVTSPKTEHSIRVVDVLQQLLSELSDHREMFPPIGDGFIFRTAKGKPIDPDNWIKRSFYPILGKAGFRRMGLHACRHTYASILIDEGANIKHVSRQLGHASIQLTADLYGHLFRETRSAVMARLDRRIVSSRDAAPDNKLTTEQPKSAESQNVGRKRRSGKSLILLRR